MNEEIIEIGLRRGEAGKGLVFDRDTLFQNSEVERVKSGAGAGAAEQPDAKLSAFDPIIGQRNLEKILVAR